MLNSSQSILPPLSLALRRSDGAVMVRDKKFQKLVCAHSFFNSDGAVMVQGWRSDGAVMVQQWCSDGAVMVR